VESKELDWPILGQMAIFIPKSKPNEEKKEGNHPPQREIDQRDPNQGGDAHGRAPIFRPVITFLPSRHRNKVDRFINRRGIIGLVGFAV
jgi:hypothetical protein